MMFPTATPTPTPVRTVALCSVDAAGWAELARAGLFVVVGLCTALFGGFISRRIGVAAAVAGVLAFFLGVVVPEKASHAQLDSSAGLAIAATSFAALFALIYRHWLVALVVCDAVTAILLGATAGADAASVVYESHEKSNLTFLMCIGAVCVTFGSAVELAGLSLVCPASALFIVAITAMTGVLTHIFAGMVCVYMLPEGVLVNMAQQEMQTLREESAQERPLLPLHINRS